MAYKCKKCGRDVLVSYRRFEGNGALMMVSVETLDGNIQDVEHCPDCGGRLLVFDDLEWIPPGDYKREDERTAAI